MIIAASPRTSLKRMVMGDLLSRPANLLPSGGRPARSSPATPPAREEPKPYVGRYKSGWDFSRRMARRRLRGPSFGPELLSDTQVTQSHRIRRGAHSMASYSPDFGYDFGGIMPTPIGGATLCTHDGYAGWRLPACSNSPQDPPAPRHSPEAPAPTTKPGPRSSPTEVHYSSPRRKGSPAISRSRRSASTTAVSGRESARSRTRAWASRRSSSFEPSSSAPWVTRITTRGDGARVRSSGSRPS